MGLKNLSTGNNNVGIKLGDRIYPSIYAMINDLYSILVTSVNAGFSEVLDRLFDDIALKEGDLRDAFLRAMSDHIFDVENDVSDLTAIFSSEIIEQIMISALDYAEYHITNNSIIYKNPTTPNTRTISKNEIVDVFVEGFIQRRDVLLRSKGVY